MDIAQAVSGYITKMVSVGDSAAAGTSAAKMKILLLDNETVGLCPYIQVLAESSDRSSGYDSFDRYYTVRPPQP